MPDTDIETERQVRRLEEQFKRLSITDSEGDLESGFVIRRQPIEVSSGIGACCFNDGSCDIETPIDCTINFGLYLGDGIVCTPNPCEAICGCPVATLHADANITLTVTDNRQCSGSCADVCSVSASINQSASEDNTQICNEFGWNDDIIIYDLVLGDGSSSCGGLTLNTVGTVTASYGVFLDGADPPCNGRLRLEARWNINGHSGFTHFCGDDCPDLGTTWDTLQDFTLSNIKEPSGTYVMNHTITASDYSANVVLTITIS